MIKDNPDLIDAIRARFAHVDTCPFQGQRIFFENAGGALTLKSVVETSGFYASIPDNPGRINPAGQGTQNVEQLACRHRGRRVLAARSERGRGLNLDFDVGGQQGELVAALFDQHVGQDGQRVALLHNAGHRL